MFPVISFMALGFGVFLLVGLVSGVCLGVQYLLLLKKRAPLPAWVPFIRWGWFAFAAGLSTLFYFDDENIHRFSTLALFAAFTCWLLALYDWRRKP